jgi:ATP-dependent RNA helicase DeaD
MEIIMNNISKFKEFNLSEDILQALDSLGYKSPTKVQEEVIPQIQLKKDVIVRSRTGSGKTASFAIPICEEIDWQRNKPQALVLTPTRELAVQVTEDFIHIGRFKRIKATAIFGRQPFNEQKLELKSKNHVVVGTPGRILDHITRGTNAFNQIQYLVLDEVDEMLNMGFLEQVEAIIKVLSKKRVTLLFSATIPDRIKTLCKTYMVDQVEINIEEEDITTDRIKHYSYEIEDRDKLSLLEDVLIVENPDSSIIFCNTIENVDKVHQHLKKLNCSCQKIHGDMEQEDRLEVMSKYKRGTFRYLIATDVAARGIDIDNVSLIINYDVPYEKEVYVHRIGRTGRKDLEGRGITFVTSKDDRYMGFIKKYINSEIIPLTPPTKEDIDSKREDFTNKVTSKLKPKTLKSDAMNKSIMKLHFNGGKNKKIRTVHFVAAIANIEGVTADDIGIITILDRLSYVEILNGKGPLVLEKLQGVTLNGKSVKVTKSYK